MQKCSLILFTDANAETFDLYQNLSSSLSSNSSQDTITPLSGAPLASSESRSGSSTPSTISPGPSEITANRELSDDRLANIQTYRYGVTCKFLFAFA